MRVRLVTVTRHDRVKQLGALLARAHVTITDVPPSGSGVVIRLGHRDHLRLVLDVLLQAEVVSVHVEVLDQLVMEKRGGGEGGGGEGPQTKIEIGNLSLESAFCSCDDKYFVDTK